MITPSGTVGIGRGRILDLSLWLVQILLLAAFGWAAWMKIVTPIPELAAMWPWAGDLPRPMVRTLGVIDLAGGLGVVLPMATGIRPRLTIAAAVGCIALQVCALIFHLSRGEITAAPVNVVFLAMAVFIAWGRRRIGRNPALHIGDPACPQGPSDIRRRAETVIGSREASVPQRGQRSRPRLNGDHQ
jgi:hypothetical protein